MKTDPALAQEGLDIFNEDHHYIQNHPVHKLNRWGRYAFIFILAIQVGLINYIGSSINSSDVGTNPEVLSASDYAPALNSQNYAESYFSDEEYMKNRELRTYIDYDYEEVAAEEVEGANVEGFSVEEVSLLENFINATASVLSK